MLRRIGIIAVLSFIVTALAAVPAFADPVVTEVGVDASGNLTASFKEDIPVELANQQIPYVLTGPAEASYICLKKNGRAPKGGPVLAGTVSGSVQTTDTFLAEPVLDEGGVPVGAAVSGSLTLSPPQPVGLSCSKGLRLFLSSVTYGDLVLTNATLGTTTIIVGPFSRTLI